MIVVLFRGTRIQSKAAVATERGMNESKRRCSIVWLVDIPRARKYDTSLG